MTIREEIINSIVEHLKTISIADGYSMDINGKVFEWQDSILSEADLPALLVRDTDDDADDDGIISHNLKIEVDAITQAAEDSVTNARAMLGDIVKNLYELKGTGQIKDLKYIHSEIQTDQAKKITAAALTEFIIFYTSNRGEI